MILKTEYARYRKYSIGSRMSNTILLLYGKRREPEIVPAILVS